MIILDFSKAFDRVPYRHLLKKIHHYGIRGNTHKWIESFLFNRSQQEVTEDKTSESVPVITMVCPGAPYFVRCVWYVLDTCWKLEVLVVSSNENAKLHLRHVYLLHTVNILAFRKRLLAKLGAWTKTTCIL